MVELARTPPSARRRFLTPQLVLGVVGVVLIEGLLLLGGVFAAEPAPRQCTPAVADAATILDTGWAGPGIPTVAAAWSVPVRLAEGGRLVAVDLGLDEYLYFWTADHGPIDTGSVVLSFGDSALVTTWPAAGSETSPIAVTAGEVMFDAQRPVDECFDMTTET